MVSVALRVCNPERVPVDVCVSEGVGLRLDLVVVCESERERETDTVWTAERVPENPALTLGEED